MRITRRSVVLGVAVAASFAWPAQVPSAAEMRAAAEAYEARLDEAWLGRVPPSGLSAVDRAGVAHVTSLLAAVRSSGLRVVSATTRLTDARADGTVLSATVVHTFTYRGAAGDTVSTEAVRTVYRFTGARLVRVTTTPDAR